MENYAFKSVLLVKVFGTCLVRSGSKTLFKTAFYSRKRKSGFSLSWY